MVGHVLQLQYLKTFSFLKILKSANLHKKIICLGIEAN